jgi:hypothetical protein
MVNNLNILENINFKLVLGRAPNVEFFSKSVVIPSISIGSSVVPTPFSAVNLPGDHMTFGPLDVTFRIDENLANWTEIFNWMNSIAFPEDYDQYGMYNENGIPISLTCDIELHIMSSKNNTIRTLTFKNAWPSDLAGLSIDIDQEGVVYAETTVSFLYDTFTLNTNSSI